MYVFGGRGVDRCDLGDLTSFKLSTQRWFRVGPISSNNIGPSPSKRCAMASEGTLVFVLGGVSPAIAQGDETALIHVLDRKHVKYPNLDSHAVKPSENTTQLARKSPAGSLTQEQPQHPMASPSDAYAAHCDSPF
ncbi:hypothetical protein DFH94DRAFT_239808 [Russula ochroleuca]|uniref:Uncharacterized protein n=1 Tax=Russula ochroleuca TaxID=152965 RepID=A0A9P5TCM4_9AGAM|nr:hypothetical protein DFH94DRAFT_239808 [Russula ochroleuca]